MIKLNQFLRYAGLPLFFYSIIIIFVLPKELRSLSAKIIFFWYAVFIFWIVWMHALREKATAIEKTEKYKNFFLYLFLCSGIFFIVSRLLPFLRYGEAPLGYDTGFYLQAVDQAVQSIGGHRPIRSLLWVPFVLLGVPRGILLHGLYLLFQFLIVGSLYMLARTLAPSFRFAYAAISLFLFAVSIPQFYAYWWMFYQMEFAVALLLMTLALLHRRSLLALITGGFGAALHPATFLPFGIALGLFALVRGIFLLVTWKKIEKETVFLIALAVITLIFFRLFMGEITEFTLVYLRGTTKLYGWFTTQYPEHLRQQFTGLYIPFGVFKLANIYLFPFAGIGILLFLFRAHRRMHESAHRFLFLFCFGSILFIFSYFPFLYQNRFLILLDLTLILFSVYPLFSLFHYFLDSRTGWTMLLCALLAFTSYASYIVWHQQPQVFPDELRELKALASLDPESYSMATDSLYMPWVATFSGHATIDPGYFQNNLWTYDMWREFWHGKSNARRHELLRMYDRPIYIFIGRHIADYLPYKKFIKNDARFISISPSVWRYNPRSISLDEIASLRAMEEAALSPL